MSIYFYGYIPIRSKARMKTRILILFAALLGASALKAQQVIRVQSCEDSIISQQVDSLKSMFDKEGYQLLKEASIMMESDFEMPVVVPLTQGTDYQFVFIGDNTSRLYEVRMFDWRERQVVFKQNKWADVDGNIISYGYVPQFTEFHMIKPVQVNKKKKKGLCGYVMLFKKNHPTSTAQVTTASHITTP